MTLESHELQAAPASMGISVSPAPAWTREQIDLIKSTVARGATDLELQFFLAVAQRCGLDPLTKQIHAVKRWSNVEKRDTMAIQVGIDGYRLIAARTGLHMGTEDAVFDSEEAEHPNKATVTVYRYVRGEKVAFSASARWVEYVQTTREGDANQIWRKMPFLMLSKTAEALALRKAFPAELSGVYTHEEMQQADSEPAPLRTMPKPADALPPEPPHMPPPTSYMLSQPQRRRLFAIAKTAGVSNEDMKCFMEMTMGLEHTADLSREQYDQLCTDLENGGVQSWLLSQSVTNAHDEPTTEEMKG